MVKHLALRRMKRRSSALPIETGKPSTIIQRVLTRIDTIESAASTTRPNSAAGSSRPSNKARKGRSRNQVPPPSDQEGNPTLTDDQDFSSGAQEQRTNSNLADILNSATVPPSPVCAMDPAAEEVHHICPLRECDCRKSLTPIRRSAQIPKRMSDLRIILLVTSINSFAQLVYARLKERASAKGDVAIKIFFPGTKCTNGTSDLIDELVEFGTDIILCPFLTAKIPSELYKRVSNFIHFTQSLPHTPNLHKPYLHESYSHKLYLHTLFTTYSIHAKKLMIVPDPGRASRSSRGCRTLGSRLDTLR